MREEALAPCHEAARRQRLRQRDRVPLHLHFQRPECRRELRHRSRPHQPPPVDDDEPVADLLDLPQQVGRHQHGDPELPPRAPHQVQHLVATGGIEAVRGLVQEDQARVVHERLRELHALLHARRVAADLAVALFEQAHVAQRLRRALAGGGAGQSAHLRQVRHELRRREIGWQAVVLRHIADQLPDLAPLRLYVHAQHAGAAARCRQQAQENFDQRALARPVCPHQPDHARLDVDVERVQRRHPGVLLGQGMRLDEGHSSYPSLQQGTRLRGRVSLPQARPAASCSPAPPPCPGGLGSFEFMQQPRYVPPLSPVSPSRAGG